MVAADGTVEVDRIGGNALWAAMGARLAGGRPRVVAVVGDDFPASVVELLVDRGCDVRVRRNGNPVGLRVSYSYDEAGVRTQPADPRRTAGLPADVRARVIDTTTKPAIRSAALPEPGDLDGADNELAPGLRPGWHLGVLPLDRFDALVGAVAGRGGYVQADCPDRNELREGGEEALRDTLPLVDVFLPSTSDTAVFAPGRPPAETLDRFRALGARTVVLKCGEDGVIVEPGDGQRERWRVPAVTAIRVIDTVGCGDAFAGAFGVDFARTGDLLSAACAGNAAASFAAEVRAPLDLLTASSDEYATRRDALHPRIEPI